MGLIKNLGKAVKKATKQISFKNLVKVAGKLDPTGVVGSIQDAHYANKEAKQLELQNQTFSNPNIGQVLQGGAGGALIGMGSVLAGSNTAATAGATLVENTTTEWLKRNWLKLVGGLLGAVTIVMLFVRLMPAKGRRTYRR